MLYPKGSAAHQVLARPLLCAGCEGQLGMKFTMPAVRTKFGYIHANRKCLLLAERRVKT